MCSFTYTSVEATGTGPTRFFMTRSESQSRIKIMRFRNTGAGNNCSICVNCSCVIYKVNPNFLEKC
jgi:hypothetical protein